MGKVGQVYCGDRLRESKKVFSKQAFDWQPEYETWKQPTPSFYAHIHAELPPTRLHIDIQDVKPKG